MQAGRTAAVTLLEGSRQFSATVAALAGPTVTLSWGIGQQVILEADRRCAAAVGHRRRRLPPPPPPASAAVLPLNLLPYPLQGALGIRSTRDQHEPEEIPDLPNNIVSLGAGHYSSFACTVEASYGPWSGAAEQAFGCVM